MKKPKKTSQNRAAATRPRLFRVGVVVLFAIGGVAVIARYESRGDDLQRKDSVAGQPGKNLVSVEVGGKKLQVNARRFVEVNSNLNCFYRKGVRSHSPGLRFRYPGLQN